MEYRTRLCDIYTRVADVTVSNMNINWITVEQLLRCARRHPALCTTHRATEWNRTCARRVSNPLRPRDDDRRCTDCLLIVPGAVYETNSGFKFTARENETYCRISTPFVCANICFDENSQPLCVVFTDACSSTGWMLHISDAIQYHRQRQSSTPIQAMNPRQIISTGLGTPKTRSRYGMRVIVSVVHCSSGLLHGAFRSESQTALSDLCNQKCQTRFYLTPIPLRLVDAVDRRRTKKSVVQINDTDRNRYGEKFNPEARQMREKECDCLGRPVTYV